MKSKKSICVLNNYKIYMIFTQVYDALPIKVLSMDVFNTVL